MRQAFDPRRYAACGWGLVAFLLVLGLTFAVWQQSRESARNARQFEFRFRADNVVNAVTDNLNAHVQTLLGAAGMAAANPDVTPAQWGAYVGALHMPQRLPGARAIGFAKRITGAEKAAHVQAMRAQGFGAVDITPAGERDELVVVTLIEPLDDRNAGALGIDLWHLPERRAAMERARDQAAPAITEKVTLVREPRAEEQPSFLLFVPVFKPGMPLDTIAARRAALTGFTYSPFRARDFVLARQVADYVKQFGAALEIYDGAQIDERRLLYRSADLAKVAGPAITIAEMVAGRVWTFRLASVPTSLPHPNQQASLIILLAGILISILVGAVVGGFVLARVITLESNARLHADMEERQRVERQLRESEDKFHRLFDSLPLPAFAIDRETLRYFAVNEAAVRKYGYSHAEFAQMQVHDVRPPADVPAFLHYMESVRHAESYEGEFRHKTRDGTIFDIELRAQNIEIDGRPATLVVAQDISERKRNEQALQENEQRVQQSQKLEAIGQLTGGIAHDFNNILTVITGTIEILADGVAHDPTLAGITRLMDDAARRGADLTRDLLAFARRQPLQPRATEINNLVIGASKLFRSALGEDIEIESKLALDLWPAYVDPSQLTTAVLNLALNARDAMTGGGKLLIETHNVRLDDAYAESHADARPGEYVMIAISDTGSGIAPAILEKVFEPFFTTKDVGKGTGLGLSMVYGFVKQSGGHVRIYSEQGVGTTVKLYVPRAEQHQLAAELAPASAPRGGETVLAVEDDDLVRNYVTAQLRSLGYVTLLAANAADALRIVDAGTPFDLLFTDVVMPGGMNGQALADEVLRRRPNVKVLFTSGYTEHAAVSGGRLDPGMPLLSKPYRKAELAQKLRAVLDAPAPSAAEPARASA